MPNVSTDNGGGADDSAANLSVIPEVSIAAIPANMGDSIETSHSQTSLSAQLTFAF